MEIQKKKYFNSYNNINSPIFNYYSHIINKNDPQYNKEIFQINNSISNLPTERNKRENNKINKINEFIKEDSKKELNNNIIESDEIKNNYIKNNSEINIENTNNLEKNKNFINTKNINKKIKSIKPEDLIPTSINGRIILRINPLVYKNESYEFLSSNIYILLKDQIGCKYLQEKLETDTIKAVCYFYPAILPNLLILIKDSFANYFIQKICYYLNDEQIEVILNILKPEFFDICCDNYGTRSIQGIMNYLQTNKLKVLFFEIIKPFFISLINETNGIHIIYKFVNQFPEFLNEVNIIIIDNCVNLALNKKGSFFLQNYLMIINNNNNYKNDIIERLINNCLILIVDKIGNYIIQYLLNLGEYNIITNIINKVIDNICFYSKHKYSNYVIEKIFLLANYEDKKKIIIKLATPEIMSDLIFDPQGYFIILKALMFADNKYRNIMLNITNNLESKIKEYPHGKIFLKKVYGNNQYIRYNNDNNYNNNNRK